MPFGASRREPLRAIRAAKHRRTKESPLKDGLPRFRARGARNSQSLYTRIAGKASAEVAFAFTTSIVDHCETFITFRQRRARPRRPPGRPCARSVFADARAIAFYVGSDTVTIVAIFLMAGITLTRALRGDVDKEGSVS